MMLFFFVFLTLVGSMVLTGDEVWVLSSTESLSVSLAVKDVLLDAYLTLGRRPFILDSPPQPGDLPSNTTLIFVGSVEAAPWLVTAFPRVPAACLTGYESHCVLVGGGAVTGYTSTIVATGTGLRGAIFGAYALSEGVLGVNPWKHFTDDVPSFSAPLSIENDLALIFAPPRFKFRGFFVNDEDLLAQLFPDPLGLAAIDLRAYSRILETLLRLKANTIVPATNPFPDQQLNALVGRRGVVLSFHHYDLVGANVFSWPLASSDWNWKKNSGTMSALYQSAIAAQAAGNGEILWSVGLRGLNDEPYPCSSQAECGAAVSAAIGNQSAWIRSAPGQANATLMFYTWSEDLELLVGGHLVLPENTQLVFTDAGNGYIRVNSNWTSFCDGVYYHTAMYNQMANQLSEMVPADRIFAQFGPVINASKTTTIVIDNVSDLRPVPMTTAAVFALAWDPTPYVNATSPSAAAADFYARFAAQQLHLPSATDATAIAYASIWSRFFAVPYIQNGISDNFFQTKLSVSAGKAVADISTASTVPANALAEAKADVLILTNNSDSSGASVISALGALLADARTLAPSIPAARVGWYTSHTITQFSFHLGAAQALVSVRDALVAADARDWGGAAQASAAALEAAERVLATLRTGEAASAPNTWRGLYAGDFLSNWQGARDIIFRLVAAIQAPGQSLPLPPVVATQSLWYQWDRQWQGAADVAAAYPLSQRFDPSVAFSRMIRTNCVFSDVDAGRCETNPTGGIWIRGSGAGVTLQILMSQTVRVDAEQGEEDGLTIRFTIDGSLPTSASPPYKSAIKLDAVGGDIVTITAAPFNDTLGAAAGPIKTTTWRAH